MGPQSGGIVIFADTFFYAALLNKRDASHAAAVKRSAGMNQTVVTTAWVLTELCDGMTTEFQRRTGMKLVRMLQTNPNLRLIQANQQLFEDGLSLFESRPDKEWSLSDCISFVVMRRFGITDALTADHHFEQAGFRALLKS